MAAVYFPRPRKPSISWPYSACESAMGEALAAVLQLRRVGAAE